MVRVETHVLFFNRPRQGLGPPSAPNNTAPATPPNHDGLESAEPDLQSRWPGVRAAGPPGQIQEAGRRSRVPSTMGNASRRESRDKSYADQRGPSKACD